MDPAQRRLVFAAVSLLLAYPDDELMSRLGDLRLSAEQMEGASGEAVLRFVEHLERTPSRQLAIDYVETFDLRRRCCLYLSYYPFGDTRRRGTAMLRFTDAYRRAGLELPAGELPDHLGVVCNFAALVPGAGLELLVGHRVSIDLLGIALREAGSPYAQVVDALLAVLPPATQENLDEALELARRGPAAEEVGLEPFAPPEYMGGLKT